MNKRQYAKAIKEAKSFKEAIELTEMELFGRITQYPDLIDDEVLDNLINKNDDSDKLDGIK